MLLSPEFGQRESLRIRPTSLRAIRNPLRKSRRTRPALRSCRPMNWRPTSTSASVTSGVADRGGDSAAHRGSATARYAAVAVAYSPIVCAPAYGANIASIAIVAAGAISLMSFMAFYLSEPTACSLSYCIRSVEYEAITTVAASALVTGQLGRLLCMDSRNGY